MTSLSDITGNFHPNIVMRNMIYDAIDDPAHACSLMNLPGTTPEGDEWERKESAKRIERLGPLIPMILACSDWMSRVITAVQVEDEESGVVEEMEDDVQEAVMQVIRAGIVSTLSAFFEIGLLTFPEFTK